MIFFHVLTTMSSFLFIYVILLLPWFSSGYMDVTNRGKVIIGDDFQDEISIYNKNGELLNRFNMLPGFDVEALVYHKKKDLLFVFDQYQMLKVTLDGTFIQIYSLDHPDFPLGRLDVPDGAAVNSKGKIYAADASTGTPQILKYSPSGNLLKIIGSQGTKKGQFLRAKDVSIDPKNRVYVLDDLRHNVQVFSESGKYKWKWGQEGTGLKNLQTPTAIAVDVNSIVHICDAASSSVKVFSKKGNFKYSFGANKLTGCHELAITPKKKNSKRFIYVRDNLGFVKFNRRGKFISRFTL